MASSSPDNLNRESFEKFNQITKEGLIEILKFMASTSIASEVSIVMDYQMPGEGYYPVLTLTLRSNEIDPD